VAGELEPGEEPDALAEAPLEAGAEVVDDSELD
jgi:hypothetical protein